MVQKAEDGDHEFEDLRWLMRKTIPVDVREVVQNLQETDMTGDKEWVKDLTKTIRKLGLKWFLGPVKIAEIQNDNTTDEDDLLEDYASGVDIFPPVVLVPETRHGYKWFVTDGGHRTATLQALGRKTVLAYYPAG